MEKIKEIAQKRKEFAEARAAMLAQQAILEATPEAQRLNELSDVCSGVVKASARLEAEYKDECTAQFRETDEKKYPGGQIKMYTALEYDTDKAVNWSLEHGHAGLMNLNKRAFEKVAKELKPEFVEINQVGRMTLASDLSEFIVAPEE